MKYCAQASREQSTLVFWQLPQTLDVESAATKRLIDSQIRPVSTQRPQGLATRSARCPRVCRCARRVVTTATFLSARRPRDLDAYRMGDQPLIRRRSTRSLHFPQPGFRRRPGSERSRKDSVRSPGPYSSWRASKSERRKDTYPSEGMVRVVVYGPSQRFPYLLRSGEARALYHIDVVNLVARKIVEVATVVPEVVRHTGICGRETIL